MHPQLTRRAAFGAAAGLALPSIVRAQSQTVLKLAHTDPVGGARQAVAERFAADIAELTQGRYRLQIYPAGQLGNDVSQLEQLRLGSVDFAVTATGTYGTHVRTLNLSALPYLVDGYEQGWKFYDESGWFRTQFDRLPARGMRIVSVWEAGFRSFSTKTELRSPADAAGKKIRVYPNDIVRWIVESLGFTAVVLPITDVYLAIQQGAVTGQENPIDTIFAQKFYEVAPFISLTRHVYSPIPMAASERNWQRMPEADRTLISQAAKQAALFSRKLIQDQEELQLTEMQAKGAKILRPDIGPFRSAMQAVNDHARQAYGAADVDGLLADAEAIRRAAKG